MKKLFCTKCGKRLTVKFDGEFGYDSKTGKKIYKLRCVDWRLLTEAEMSSSKGIWIGNPDNGHGSMLVFEEGVEGGIQ